VTVYTGSHWGLYEVHRDTAGSAVLRSYAQDPDPSQIGLDQLSEDVARLRVRRPAVRKGWLEAGANKNRSRRGQEPFVEVSWEVALDLVAKELDRVVQAHGNSGIFGGSYGWSSSGRFHHAQSQIKRFLNCIGGFVGHRDSYSHAAGNVVLPHIIAPLEKLTAQHTSWEVMIEHTELFVAFGGVPLKNAQVTSGGAVRHQVRGGLNAMGRTGTRFVNISPQREDLVADGDVEWLPIRPNTDTALILGIATTLLDEGLEDRDFLRRYCVGFDVVEAYLLGGIDGLTRDAEWASAITAIPAARIRSLAREMASSRTMLNAAWSLQRAAHGEQVYWALVTLAAMLGQIGTPGGGFGVGYGAVNAIGTSYTRIGGPTLSQGRNGVDAFIPVARIADLLLGPGERFTYNGSVYTYPDIRLVYWAGGNPFHHHQDLNRLVTAWRRPDTVIVHEQFWNPLAKMADIVLPATTTLERNDIGFDAREGHFVAMKKVSEPVGESRNDHDIFAALAQRLNVGPAFSEGRDEMGWLRHLYGQCRDQAAKTGVAIPDFEDFWRGGLFELPRATEPVIMLRTFRENPERYPLSTPSGRIELFSETVSSFGYADCPGYAVWLDPPEWLGSSLTERFPLHLITNQPLRRLHSQLDHAQYSVAGKVRGHEVISMNSADAAVRGISHHELVRVFNDRGSCLAVVAVTDSIAAGTVNLCTGAWFDPESWLDGKHMDKHGNPNILTRDFGTSSLAQGCAAQSCLVEISRYDEPPPKLSAFDLPPIMAAPTHGE
jgi:biotin/methionine sulfoxide reductase